MARKRRSLDPVSLSFLDVMSCGFGAMILLFLILKHQGTDFQQEATPADSEVRLLEREVTEGRRNLAELRATAADLHEQNSASAALLQQLLQEMAAAAPATEDNRNSIEQMRRQLAELEQRKRQIQEEIRAKGANLRERSGTGRRAYLTGLRLDSKRTLILLDASSSMLAENLVNVIRFRNMDDAAKKLTPKWRQAVDTVAWLVARLTPEMHFQIYLFDTSLRAAVPGTEGTWLNTGATDAIDRAVEAVENTVPQGGTSLATAFSQITRLNPAPDNIILITDGLPTQGTGGGGGGTISGRERARLFADAIRTIPARIPVNTILLPMEGDPDAAGSFWLLAQRTTGSLLTPTRDWP
ncbi:MAG: VWA domain-containing protein [Gammaproteobacteria bacterium]|nr:VWA domain-containing protein [Gammaproteobacteria bacterium]